MLSKGKRMKGDDIALLFSRAKSVKNPLFLMKYLKNEVGGAKIAVAASKKIFKTAVSRNKIRRRMYTAIRAAKADTLPFFIVFMPNNEAIKAPYRTLVEAIEYSCKVLKKS